MTESPPPGGGSPPSQMFSPSGGLLVISAWAGGSNFSIPPHLEIFL